MFYCLLNIPKLVGNTILFEIILNVCGDLIVSLNLLMFIYDKKYKSLNGKDVRDNLCGFYICLFHFQFKK